MYYVLKRPLLAIGNLNVYIGMSLMNMYINCIKYK